MSARTRARRANESAARARTTTERRTWRRDAIITDPEALLAAIDRADAPVRAVETPAPPAVAPAPVPPVPPVPAAPESSPWPTCARRTDEEIVHASAAGIVLRRRPRAAA